MAIFGNFKGTTKSEFQIGKTAGNKISTSVQPSSDLTNGDLYIDSGNSTLQVYDSGWKSIGETLTSLNVDSGTLFVDSSNDTVSIGSTSSNEKLFVNGNLRLGTNPSLQYSGAYLDLKHSNGSGSVIRVRDNNTGTDPIFKIYDANNTSEVFKVEGRTVTFTDQEFTNSNIMKFNQMYTGASTGSYFTNGEYQKVVTIIPDGNSQNYQVIGRITAQNAAETHTVYFDAALRSGTLPDLSWTILYDEEYNGNRYIDPQLWTKETTTAGFIFAFKTLATIYGTVTCDFEVIPRNSSQKTNVTVNTTQNSEQASVDTGYTANDMTLRTRKQGSTLTVKDMSLEGNIIPSANVTYDLGSDALRWRDLYLSGSTINLGTTKISINADNEIDFSDSANSSIKRKLVVDEIHLGDGADAVVLRKGSSGKFETKTQNRSSKSDSANKVDLDDNNTDDLAEGSTNLYYTDARANAAISTGFASRDSDDVKEGSSNLYYTTARANSAIDAKLTGDITLGNVTSQSVSSGVVSGVLFEPITDYGLITSPANITIDYGAVTDSATAGDFEYLNDIFGPTGDTFTVAKVPSAAQPGQMIFISDETGGPVMAFSDGTNWRRITDRAIISS